MRIYFRQVKSLTLLRRGSHLPKTPVPACLLVFPLALFLERVCCQRQKVVEQEIYPIFYYVFRKLEGMFIAGILILVLPLKV